MGDQQGPFSSSQETFHGLADGKLDQFVPQYGFSHLITSEDFVRLTVKVQVTLLHKRNAFRYWCLS